MILTLCCYWKEVLTVTQELFSKPCLSLEGSISFIILTHSFGSTSLKMVFVKDKIQYLSLSMFKINRNILKCEKL